MSETFDLIQLFRTVFAPQPGERITLLADLPHDALADNAAWADRRALAQEWQNALQRASASLGVTVNALVSYPATGQSNGPLPSVAWQEGQEVSLFENLRTSDIALALSEYSATAPLMSLGREIQLRGASLPRVARRMQQTALAADYAEVARKCGLLAERLQRAEGAEVRFSTGHRLFMDLRYRDAHRDDGRCHPGTEHPFINLPSGEAYKAPYEGERPGEPSRTAGEIPASYRGETLLLRVEQNRLIEVQGNGEQAETLRAFLAVDRARCNLAELGLGCNDRAVVTGNVLEDEKAGFHWAFGRSEHLGGTVGPDSFSHPSHIVHSDLVYAPGSAIGIAQLVLQYADGGSEEIMRDSAYTIF